MNNIPTTRIVCAILLIQILIDSTCFAQQPGGRDVPGAKFWLISSTKKEWKSNNQNQYLKFGNAVADTQNINYHTALKFSTAKTIGLSNLKPVSIVAPFYPESTSTTTPDPDSFYRVDYNGSLLSKFNYNNAQIATRSGVLSIKSTAPILSAPSNTAMKLTAFYFSGYPAVDLGSPAGYAKETKLTMRFTGYCPEMLIYETPLSPMDIWKLQTYFAIKYGITLDASYISTNGKDTLWNRTTRMKEGFHNRVCAIGRDNDGAIDQQISNTTYEDSVYNAYKNASNGGKRSVSIGFDSKDYPDKSFLFWSDNDGPTNKFVKRKINNADPNKPIETVARKWIMQNNDAIKQTTRVELGGILFGDPKDDDYCYLMVKLNASLDSSDIFPLDTMMKNGKFYRSHIVWNNSLDTFTFGRVEKLEFSNTGNRCNYKKNTAHEAEYIKAKSWFLGAYNNIVGYYYRSWKSNPIACPPLPPDFKQQLLNNELEIYFSGGIGPFQYQIGRTGKFKSFAKVSKYPDGGYNIGLISDPELVSGKSYEIIITDMTRQRSDVLNVKIP